MQWLLSLIAVIGWLNVPALVDDGQEIALAPIENGVGIFAATDLAEDCFWAEQDAKVKCVYKAVVNGEELTFLAVADGVYQLVDDIDLTRDNFETVISSYCLPDTIADDLRKVCQRARLFLPKKMAEPSTSADYLAHYQYEGCQLAKMACVVTPIERPQAYVIITDKAKKTEDALNKWMFRVVDSMRVGLLSAGINSFFFRTIEDRIDVTLQEYKMRTYISVWEKDKYIPASSATMPNGVCL